jgi:hypothetical protein
MPTPISPLPSGSLTLRRVLYQCRLPPRTTRTERWQRHERLECNHLIRVKFDHLGQITTAARRRCPKCADSLPADPISDAENETKIILAKGSSMDEKLSNKFATGAILAELLDLDFNWMLGSPDALYAALEAQGYQWSGAVWFALHGYRSEISVLDGKGYYATIYNPRGVVVHSTTPCGDDEGRARKEARESVGWFETAAFKAAQVSEAAL